MSGSKRKRHHSPAPAVLDGIGDFVQILRDESQAREQNGTETHNESQAREKNGNQDPIKALSGAIDNVKKRKVKDNRPAIWHSPQSRLNSQIKIDDLQDLVLYLLVDGKAPQWLSIANHYQFDKVVVLMVPGLELDMFNGRLPLSEALQSAQCDQGDNTASTETTDAKIDLNSSKLMDIGPDDYYPVSLNPDNLSEPLKPLSEIFPKIWPVQAHHDSHGFKGPWHNLRSPLDSMLRSPVPKIREEHTARRKGSGPRQNNNRTRWENKPVPITTYIVDLADQQDNNIPPHPAWYTTPEARDAYERKRKEEGRTSDDGWVDTNVNSLAEGEVPKEEIDAKSRTAGREIYSIDCEMCKSIKGESVLTRISVMNWNGEIVLDELVKPDVPIADYLTRFSGITEAKLEGVTTTLADVQKKLLELLTPHTILLGHSIESDLNAVKLTHPFVIDTSILFPHHKGHPIKWGLKALMKNFLNKEIQKSAEGHDSTEDAWAVMQLVKEKCERGPEWGTGAANIESIFKRLSRATRRTPDGGQKAGAVVDWGFPERGHGGQAQVVKGCKSDKEVVENIRAVLKENPRWQHSATTDSADFVWARLRELELVRGWWDYAKTPDVEAIRKAAYQRLRPSHSPDNDIDDTHSDAVGAELGEAVARTVKSIQEIWHSLEPRTAFIVYSGTNDPREIRRLQQMQRDFKNEYRCKKWDELSVKWTDTEIGALSRACKDAANGVGFITVKNESMAEPQA